MKPHPDYDSKNIFARVLRGELPSKTVYEDKKFIAIHDAFPKAPVHVLVLTKNPYISFDDFTTRADAEEVSSFFKVVKDVAQKMGLAENGYRLIMNHKRAGGQEIDHFHLHILGGRSLGPMVIPQGDPRD